MTPPTEFHLRRARDLMDARYADPLELDDLASAAGFSRYHFAREFRAAFGETPAAYLSRRRVERAKDLLASANLTVTEVCMVVGFASLSSFSRRFHPTRRLLAKRVPAPGWCPHRTGRTTVISRLTHNSVYVLDQDSAKEFYLDKLGFELRNDVIMGEGFEGAGQGFRWLTVSPPGQPEIEFILADCRMGHSPGNAEEIRALVAKGAMGLGVLGTDDYHKTYRELRERGVVFLEEPSERPYGIEATFRDDSGNVYSLTEARQPAS